MSEASSEPAGAPSKGRGRGRGRGSRGGLGKYLRARGRGRGGGRPAVFGQRLLLEGEGPNDEEDDEEAAERAARFSRRQLGTNADRYAEPEPELDSDGEPIVEPEIDLSSFLERQRISDAPTPSLSTEDQVDDDDVDHSLDHISSNPQRLAAARSKKGKVSQIEWDKELDELSREKAAAEATWELRSRFRVKSERLKAKPTLPTNASMKRTMYIDAPALPLPDGTAPQPKDPKAEMEDFLDDLLS